MRVQLERPVVVRVYSLATDSYREELAYAVHITDGVIDGYYLS